MVFLQTLSFLWKGSSGHDKVRPIMLYARLRFDETPTKVRVLDSSTEGAKSTALVAELADPSSESTSATLHTKVMQTEHIVGILLHDRREGSRGQYTWVYSELPTALKAVHSTNGLNTLACLKDTLDRVPGFHQFGLEQGFKFCIRHTCSDSYSANFAALRGLEHETPGWTSLHGLCDVHKLYTATKTAMSTVDHDISGVLNLALALGEAGSLGKLRKILSRTLGNNLLITFGTPPVENKDSMAYTYRKELFDLFLPTVGVDCARVRLNKQRRYILEYFLNGELFSHDICHVCKWGCCSTPDQTWKYFGSYVSWALLPCGLHRFPRSRWTEWDKSLDWVGLLAGVHGLFQRVLVEFLTGKPLSMQPATSSSSETMHAAPSFAIDDWDAVYCAEGVQGASTTQPPEAWSSH